MISKPKKRKLNPMLLNVLLISGGAHVALILILGGMTIVRFVIPDEAQFEEPPKVEEIEPVKEVKVVIQPQAAPQQQPLNNLKVKQIGSIAIDNIDVDLPSMEESFTVSSGIGGLGGNSLMGGARGSIGIGMSDVSIFGLTSRAERFLFAIDASKTMLTDEKGGLNSYRVIKEEISTMVSNLSAGTLFNVVFFDNGRFQFFKPNLVPAGTEVTQELAKWIGPVNANAQNVGLSGKARPEPLRTYKENLIQDNLPDFQGQSGNENAYLTQIFLEQNIDAIFVITGRHEGFEPVRRSATKEENAAWAETTSSSSYQKALKAHKEESVEARKVAEKKLAKLNAERKSKGLPPKIFDGGSLIGQMGVELKNKHPGHQPNHYIAERDVVRYFKDLVKTIYQDRGGEAPSVNVVLFLAGDEKYPENKEEQLDDYVDEFGGDYRVIRGLNEIKGASSSANTKN